MGHGVHLYMQEWCRGKSEKYSLNKAFSDAKMDSKNDRDNLLKEKTGLLLKTKIIDEDDVTSADAKFGSGDFRSQSKHPIESDAILKEWAKKSSENKEDICKRWKCFEKTVNMDRMEFRDVKNYTTVSIIGNQYKVMKKSDKKYYNAYKRMVIWKK